MQYTITPHYPNSTTNKVHLVTQVIFSVTIKPPSCVTTKKTYKKIEVVQTDPKLEIPSNRRDSKPPLVIFLHNTNLTDFSQLRLLDKDLQSSMYLRSFFLRT
jgi:hypothetical protein